MKDQKNFIYARCEFGEGGPVATAVIHRDTRYMADIIYQPGLIPQKESLSREEICRRFDEAVRKAR